VFLAVQCEAGHSSGGARRLGAGEAVAGAPVMVEPPAAASAPNVPVFDFYPGRERGRRRERLRVYVRVAAPGLEAPDYVRARFGTMCTPPVAAFFFEVVRAAVPRPGPRRRPPAVSPFLGRVKNTSRAFSPA